MTQSTSGLVVPTWRLRTLWIGLYLLLALIVARLFYWQIIKGATLRAEAQEQYQRTQTLTGARGQIYTADGKLLVGNQTVYRVFGVPPQLKASPAEVATQLVTTLWPFLPESQAEASQSGSPAELQQALIAATQAKLSQGGKWISLFSSISSQAKDQLAAQNMAGLGFEARQIRWYPEASMAAHITGFVGRDEQDLPTGYFGVEGSLDKELRARQTRRTIEKDALGFHLWGSNTNFDRTEGRNVVLTIRRDVQLLTSQMLLSAMQRYGAKAGEIIVYQPKTGRILAAASYPNYDPLLFTKFPAETYKNPSVTAFYEPGSTFKTLTVSAGIDAGVITPDTPCQACSGPRQIDKYSIKTWNNEYHPLITMTEALAKSDNTAMVYVTDLLGRDRFVEYLKKFGINEKTYVEWQEDARPPFPSKWGPVELATAAFGQGISTTSLQMVKAVGAIANGGVMMRPTVIDKVIDPSTGEEIQTQPMVERQVIKPETAQLVTQMMEVAAASGEAKWTAAKTHRVAAKTGTSQVAVDGAYDEDKTIASFIGFAPPDNPQFLMFVKLVEPTSSIWAAETAAPLWYQVAEKLFLLLEIPPDK